MEIQNIEIGSKVYYCVDLMHWESRCRGESDPVWCAAIVTAKYRKTVDLEYVTPVRGYWRSEKYKAKKVQVARLRKYVASDYHTEAFDGIGAVLSPDEETARQQLIDLGFSSNESIELWQYPEGSEIRDLEKYFKRFEQEGILQRIFHGSAFSNSWIEWKITERLIDPAFVESVEVML